MDIDRFITLQTVVEEGSFARAANKLCCTQSTVTYHIKEPGAGTVRTAL